MKAKEFLSKSGYLYEIRDVDKDPDARAAFTKLGARGVPAFEIGGELVVGLDPQKLEKLLDYIINSCPNCHRRMRVPKGKGKIRVTCPHCQHKYVTAT
ncbi:MAG: glutaredoxin family protein [Tindallia sp. MSAO_Bac2]|nr:MAG: glutaredoxin family protein [Tindallia sp. MSAO_Bac2]